MLSNMANVYAQHAHVLLFLVVVNFDRFQILRSYTLLLKLSILCALV